MKKGCLDFKIILKSKVHLYFVYMLCINELDEGNQSPTLFNQ